MFCSLLNHKPRRVILELTWFEVTEDKVGQKPRTLTLPELVIRRWKLGEGQKRLNDRRLTGRTTEHVI